MNEAYFVLLPTDRRNSLEAWSRERLPFEPKGWLHDLRGEIQSGDLMLKCEPAEVPSGAYASPVMQVCDVENVLFYNVGLGTFAKLAFNGVRFERVFAKPPTPPVSIRQPMQHYHCCSFKPKGAGFTHWKFDRPLARWEGVRYCKTAEVLDVASVWRSMRLGAISGQVLGNVQPNTPFARLAMMFRLLLLGWWGRLT